MRFVVFDLRDALRGFRRDRTYAATTILTLALTIGATTAAFSIVDGILFKPLPYPDAGRLVSLREVWREIVDRAPTIEVNERHFEHWRTHATSFASMAQFGLRPANLIGAGDAVPITAVRCSGSLFDVLGVEAALGRTLAAADEPEGAPDVVVITGSLWRQRFGADPRIVGQTIVLDGKPHTVVGVLPSGFRLARRDQLTQAVDLFVPLRPSTGWVGDHNNDAIGRLRAGVTIEQARAELDVLQVQVSAIAGKAARDPLTLSSAVTPLAEHVVRASRRGLLLLLAAVVFVLLIACSNLANLALTRAVGRLREAAIRSALGASRRRLVRRAALEQLLLSAAGGALGLWVAWLGLALFVRTAAADLPRAGDVALDARALMFAATVSLLTAVLVAAVPAWRMAGREVQSALRAGSAALASDRGGLRSHAALLTLQVALSVTLLVVTALFGVSLVRVLEADRGFAAETVLAVDVALPATRYTDERVRNTTYDRLLAAVHALPGVERATTTSMLPLRGQSQVNFVAVEGSTGPLPEQPSANFRLVAPEFFQTLGIEIRRGRSFTDAERDPNRPAPALVSEPAAARLWPGGDPIGKRFSRGLGNEQGFEVVGVVADARTTSLDRAQPLMVYVPYWWRSRTSASLLIKTAVEPSSLVSAVRRVVREIDPEIAIGESRPLGELVEAAVAGRRYQTQLFVAFGVAALFIATVGVYAVTAFSVSRRRREMNIRAALGAETRQVIAMMVRQAMAPVVAGIGLGIAGALAAGNLVASLLFEVQARDPMVIAAVVALVGCVSLATCGLTAKRGMAVDPARALRDD